LEEVLKVSLILNRKGRRELSDFLRKSHFSGVHPIGNHLMKDLKHSKKK